METLRRASGTCADSHGTWRPTWTSSPSHAAPASQLLICRAERGGGGHPVEMLTDMGARPRGNWMFGGVGGRGEGKDTLGSVHKTLVFILVALGSKQREPRREQPTSPISRLRFDVTSSRHSLA